ncbi:MULTISPECIES: fimbrial protein [unclassified Tatumella]|mgnify:CR=1 FL=1|uniref:fimbrial protein n=1 Tax=unclassified Tatumella TaxID=2649542 RepID=UPI001BB05490|nr:MULTISPECIES: fimbrial protein [unclassified Tatumella]MBS0877143.1 type 1 fimbrial protein [Tatumella sp. JGM82]MBS0890589.1 type 1 fimbrial protein [Tatumella sp. JGM94]MBS0901446.1 type 1 fimbrial protein [Tatumella sp. JGM100]
MKSIFLSMITVVLFLLSPSVKAYTCSTTTVNNYISPPSMTVSRDLPVGSPIGQPVSVTGIRAFNCSNNGTSPNINYQEVGIKAYGNYVTTINNRRIYQTNIKGIGYAVAGEGCGNSGMIYVRPGNDFGGEDANLLCSINGIFSTKIVEIAEVQFYKTEQNTGIGTVSARTVGAIVMKTNKSYWESPESNIRINAFHVYTIACTVNSQVISVDMGSVKPSDFHGIGTWPGDQNTRNFNIPLTCNSDANVNIQFDGNAYDANNGLLRLNSGNDSASGVGIQLLYEKKPVVLSSVFSAGSPGVEGVFNIPLQARYYQIDKSVDVGNANTSATFTLTYK